MAKNPPADAGDMRCGFNPRVWKIPWRRAWEPTPVFLPGESPWTEQPVGYSPEGHKDSDTIEVTEHTHTYRVFDGHFYKRPWISLSASSSNPFIHLCIYLI